MAKHIGHFKSFLKKEVALNTTRLNNLDRRVEAIKKFLYASNLEIKSVFPLGSYAQGTIIRPAKENKEFDADLIVRMNVVKNWNYKDYIENLYTLFKSSSIYSSMVSRKSRCVTLDYAGDFHLDVVPLLRIDGLFGYKKYYITNRDISVIERTNPYEYNSWFLERNKIIDNNYFLESVMLFKYIRDVKQNFSVKSILLNTLLAERVISQDSRNQGGDFVDLPTTFKTLFNRLNDWLEEEKEMPLILNPSLDSENFNRHWDELKYQNFRSKIALYCDKINRAFYESNREASLAIWQEVFGPKFGR